MRDRLFAFAFAAVAAACYGAIIYGLVHIIILGAGN